MRHYARLGAERRTALGVVIAPREVAQGVARLVKQSGERAESSIHVLKRVAAQMWSPVTSKCSVRVAEIVLRDTCVFLGLGVFVNDGLRFSRLAGDYDMPM